MITSRHKALGIAGSPREGGNTDILLAQAMSALAGQGVQTQTVFLRDMKISPCLHCGGCVKTGECVINDDMQRLYPDLCEAEFVILASPLFFMGVSAQTKAMIDRCQALWIANYVLKPPPTPTNRHRKRRGIFICVGGSSPKEAFYPARATARAWFNVLGVAYTGELLVSGVDEKGGIIRHPTALTDARLAGEKLLRREQRPD